MSQDRQCAHTVTLRRVRANTVAAEKQYNIFRLFICGLRLPASNAHAPCFHLWPIRLYNTDKQTITSHHLYLFVNNAFYKAVLTHVTNYVSFPDLYRRKTIIKWTFTGYDDVN
jgi:hypothetical protein